MKLEVGKIYRTRDGGTVRITEYQENYIYPFLGFFKEESKGRVAWTEDGRYWYEGEHPFDIIVEISIFDLSKPLETMDGKPVTLIAVNGREPYPIIGYVGDETRITTWDRNGVTSYYGHNLINREPATIIEAGGGTQRLKTLAELQSAIAVLIAKRENFQVTFEEG